MYELKQTKGSARLVLVARIAADRCQGVRRNRHIAIDRQPPGNILNMRVKAAIFMRNDDDGQLCGGLCRWPRNIGAHRPVASG